MSAIPWMSCVQKQWVLGASNKIQCILQTYLSRQISIWTFLNLEWKQVRADKVPCLSHIPPANSVNTENYSLGSCRNAGLQTSIEGQCYHTLKDSNSEITATQRQTPHWSTYNSHCCDQKQNKAQEPAKEKDQWPVTHLLFVCLVFGFPHLILLNF